MDERTRYQLDETQKRIIKGVLYSAEEFSVEAQIRKNRLMLVIRRWRGDWFKAFPLWEIKDEDPDAVVQAVKTHLQACGKIVLESAENPATGKPRKPRRMG